MNKERNAKALERIGDLLSKLPEEEVEPTILHLLGVVNGVKIASDARRTDTRPQTKNVPESA